jgi:uncharacterized protein
MSPHRGKHNPRSRQLTEAWVFALLRLGLVAKWSYHCGLHGRFRVSTHEVRLPKETPLRTPLVIAFASDFHAGPTTYPKAFNTLVEELIARRPDVILLGGDYVSGHAENVEVLSKALSRCKPPLGIYGVLGNHDLWADDTYIQRQLATAGVRMLVNQSVALPPPFDCVSICGIDDPWTGEADVTRTFKDTQSIRVFLTHSPDGLLLLDKEQFDVGFAGHTHGGQVALPDGTAILSAGGPLARTYGRGRFEIAGRGPFIVSRGVGCSNLPIRMNADRELVMCTLQP